MDMNSFIHISIQVYFSYISYECDLSKYWYGCIYKYMIINTFYQCQFMSLDAFHLYLSFIIL